LPAILDLIGNTPLVELRRITAHLPENIRILVKLERCNPGGSVKDRAALNMVQEGIDSGALTAEKVILDSTSGNTGIALAMIGAAMGYKVKLVMPANVSEERKRICMAYGAEISTPIRWKAPMARSCSPVRFMKQRLSSISNPISTTTRPTRAPMS